MKKIRQWGRRVLAVSLFVVCLLLVNEGFRFLLIDDTESYTRITLHEMYEQDNIDVLFLGSSHSYRSIVPDIMDQEWQVNTFNCGTSSQQTIASYHLLKEAEKRNEISRVYMEIYYDILNDNEEYRSPTAAYIVSDYMKPSLNRLQFLWNTGGKDYLAHGLILGRRNWDRLFDGEYLINNLREKCSDDYRNYAYIKADNEDYAGKGFVYNREAIISGSFSAKQTFAPVEDTCIAPQNQKYLNKIIDYCKENEIELTFYSAPVSDFRLAGCGNYDSFSEQIENFLAGKGVAYYDFNLCKSNYLMLKDDCFKDDHHLNGKGAELFSEAFASFFAENPDSSEVFWDNYTQKLEKEEKRVFGVVCEMLTAEDGTIKATILPVDNMEEELYFAVYKRSEEEEEYTLYREYSSEQEFSLLAEERGYIHIFVSNIPKEGTHTNEVTFYYGN